MYNWWYDCVDQGTYLPLPIATYMYKSLKLYNLIRVESDLLEAYSNWSELWSVLSWYNEV